MKLTICLIFTLLFLTICHSSKTEESLIYQNNSSCKESENCSCIEEYRHLKSYVENDQKILEQLAETFYGGGKEPDFVRITYHFGLSNNSSNYSMKDENNNCTIHHHLYIWSDSFFYLLGPKSLLLLTFNVVNVHEADVSIQLPCLCKDSFDKLLHMLTVMIKTYAVKGYHDQPIQFINKHIAQAKHDQSENLNTVKILWYLLSFISLLLYMCLITTAYISIPQISLFLKAVILIAHNNSSRNHANSNVKRLKKYLETSEENENLNTFYNYFREINCYWQAIGQSQVYKLLFKGKEVASIMALIFFCAISLLLLAGLHITSIVYHVCYSEEVIGDYTAVLIVHIIEMIAIILPFMIYYCLIKYRKFKLITLIENVPVLVLQAVQENEISDEALVHLKDAMKCEENNVYDNSKFKNFMKIIRGASAAERQQDGETSPLIPSFQDTTNFNTLMLITSTVLIAVNFAYLGSFYMIFLLLAIINAPLRAVFIYSVVLTTAALFYYCLFCFCEATYSCCNFEHSKGQSKCVICYTLLKTLFLLITISFFLFLLFFIPSGSFKDFECSIQVIYPISLGILTFLGIRHTTHKKERKQILVNLLSQVEQEIILKLVSDESLDD